MTIKELYAWAVEQGVEEWKICVIKASGLYDNSVRVEADYDNKEVILD